MADYSATKAAVVAYLRAGYTTRTIYPDPTTELTTADELAGWIELEWSPGRRGLEGGRLGPTQTWYDTPFDFTARIMIPRAALGDETAWAAAWTATGAIEELLLEGQIGDLYVRDTQPIAQNLEPGDAHVQIDLHCSGFLESVK